MVVFIVQMQLLPTAHVYDGCGLQSCVLSQVPKRNIKTKLQIKTSPAAGINTIVAGCWVSSVIVSRLFNFLSALKF